MTPEQVQQLSIEGYTVLPQVVNLSLLDRIAESMDRLIPEYQQQEGVLLHILLYDKLYIELLQKLISNYTIHDIEHNYLNSKCIVNSLSAIDNKGVAKTFAHSWHRDLRFFSDGFNVMLNCLLMVDDFTTRNGGTLVLPGSHRQAIMGREHMMVQIQGNRGDMLIFNSNLWHCAATNYSGEHRRSIPITLSRPFMKQLLDYPRALGYDKVFSPELHQLLGYNSRVPASITEWTSENRMYKKDQDNPINTQK